jgi:SHS2 domain-containing protein
MTQAAGFEYPDHVSDIRIRAWGPSLEETFAQACLGMWAMVADPRDAPSRRRWIVSADGLDLDELLVNLLNEMILCLDSKGLVAGNVESVSVGGRAGAFAASAVLTGCSSAELAKPLCRYLKAATFHDLLVSATLVEVTLDV